MLTSSVSHRQLILDLGTPPAKTFKNFFAGAHGELVTRLAGLDAALSAGQTTDCTFYVWGGTGSGRSHLLEALVGGTSSSRVRFIIPPSPLSAFSYDPNVVIYAVDDVNQLADAQQIALFNLFNEVRSSRGSGLVVTGNAAPLNLAVREDVRTRLGWGLVFHLSALSDKDKAFVLQNAARERGLTFVDDVTTWLLTHYRRDMPSLMSVLDKLDRFALEHKRTVTLPLLRTMLADNFK
ncbi:DnaA regulatory inactivator Hda [Candidatus Vallotia cooleyia]|uniref:DnaA regulatory inactivator Hda n=1 Tax=Candidatus Vallotiella adelgis TaxID=1177211 RepID=UPI001D01E007|nr:DnaA regulatory inactivator Hda [Candidatus Vallotia cooleyia]UDG82154.1 DnaA regulatory inactivator Hda [Candidatus Vallotia cooleyia]